MTKDLRTKYTYKNSILRVIITGDIFRPMDKEFLSSQSKNIRWFSKLFSRTLSEATSLPIETLMWDNRNCKIDLLYESLEITKDLSGWAKIYDLKEVPTEIESFISRACQNSVVVGYEMSPTICKALSKQNILYFNFKIDPVRYLPDVFFSISSNDNDILAIIEGYSMNENDFYIWADIISATCAKRSKLDIPWNSNLILGQVSSDRSLIFDGKLVDLSNYTSPISRKIEKLQPLYFKPHPYNKTDFGVEEIKKIGYEIIDINANIYHLMSSKRFKSIYSISSGVLKEAKYFGQSVSFIEEELCCDKFYSVYNDFIDTDFWRNTLAKRLTTTPTDGYKFLRPANTIRISLNSFWGFNEISTDTYCKIYFDSNKSSENNICEREKAIHPLENRIETDIQQASTVIKSVVEIDAVSTESKGPYFMTNKTDNNNINAGRIDRIVICSDPIMTSEKEQKSNRQWLRDLITRPISRACIASVDGFSSSITNPSSLNRETFFSLSDIKFDLSSTHFWYDVDRIREASYAYLGQYLDVKTLVIGYELSQQTREIFTKLKIPYIDIWLHPIRFLDDIAFGIHSNVISINQALSQFSISDDMIFMYADRLKIQSYKGFRRRSIDIPKNSTIFIGQTNNDKSLMLDGKFLTLLDFKDRF